MYIVHFILSPTGMERLLRRPAHTVVDPSYATPAPAEFRYAELLTFIFREIGEDVTNIGSVAGVFLGKLGAD
jgi:hypothetical protein